MPAKELVHVSASVRIRNPGVPLDLDALERVQVNTSAVERPAQTLVQRRTVKKEWQVA